MLQQNGAYYAILMDDALTASIFTRLFYYDNAGDELSHFTKFHEVTDVTGQKIVVWKIDWDGIPDEPIVEEADSPEPEVTEDIPEETIEETEPEAVQEPELVKVEHILISTETHDEDEALSLAQDVLEQVDSVSFQTLVEEYSECSSDSMPCSLGWFGRGVVVAEFEDAAFALQEGETSEVIKTKHGYEIIKLISTK